MLSEFLPETLLSQSSLMLAALAALVVAAIAVFHSGRTRRIYQERLELLEEKTSTLWREVDELRVTGIGSEPPVLTERPEGQNSDARYRTEKTAYDKLWPQVWQLYDRVGAFLRAVEAGDPPGDLRLDARNAALDARARLNHNRPFCSDNAEHLITQLIDVEIKAHLTACQYLDDLKEAGGHPSDHDRRLMRDKCSALHDHEARELMTQLVQVIRKRTLNNG
ncbi:hypothetical protein MD273_04170 [Marinobacter pelagius]|uniref:hypothetical protein n=1 Tax=Marinobacter sp. C7 TaxID=2951363 RepID=UPI001EF108C9|nr:hypothetical protein [Marinobacter sp. C7]MCG7198919.1 hypothetical protein [Marinobacter sp. C7]